MPVLELREIEKSFGTTRALRGVNLRLERGEVHAIIGENGAGKSTLMKTIAGALPPDAGTITLRGKPFSPSNTLHARRQGITLIHQELSLAPHLSVAENIFMGIEPSRYGWLDRTAINAKSRAVLESFGNTDIRPEAKVGSLSTATQQIVEICRAISADAEIVLMDEPTSSLQRGDVEHLFGLIRKLKKDGVSIIYISHFLEEVREIADSFTILRDGLSVLTGRLADVTDNVIVSQMVGREISEMFPKRLPVPSSEPIFEVEQLSAPPELMQASFSVRPGEIFGIAGLMGAGRTKMARVLFGLDDAHTGKLRIRGRIPLDINSSPTRRIHDGVGYLSEDRKNEGLAVNLSLADNITATRFSACSQYGWLDRRKQASMAAARMDELGVRADSPEQRVVSLSGGNQQKVAIARLLHQDADVLLLDEPTRGIDIGSKTIIYETIAALAQDGKAIVMISSYLPELFGMCDRIAVMSRGVLLPAKPVTECTPEEVMQAAIGYSLNAI